MKQYHGAGQAGLGSEHCGPPGSCPAAFLRRLLGLLFACAALFAVLSGTRLEAQHNPYFFDAEAVEDGWYESPTIGRFYPFSENFWYHTDQGYMHVTPAGVGSLYAHQPGMGWLWTASGLYPYLFRYDLDSWLFFYSREEDWRWFYLYRQDHWHAYRILTNTGDFPYFWPAGAEEIDYSPLEDPWPPAPAELILGGSDVAHAGVPTVFVLGGEPGVEGILFTGDGNRYAVNHTSIIEHIYDYPGDYVASLYYAAPGDLPNEDHITVSVTRPVPPVRVLELSVEFYDPANELLLGPARLMLPPAFTGSSLPTVAAVVRYTATEEAGAAVVFEIETPAGTVDLLETVNVTLAATGGGDATVVVSVSNAIPVGVEGFYSVNASINLPRSHTHLSSGIVPSHGSNGVMGHGYSGAGTVTTQGAPAVYFNHPTIPGFEEMCEEMRLTLRMMQAELAAKLGHLADLLDRLRELETERAAKAAELAELQAIRDASEQAVADAEASLQAAIDAFETRYPDWQLAFDSEEQSVEEAQAELEGELFPHLAGSSTPQLPTYYPGGGGGGVAAFPTAHGYQRDVGVHTTWVRDGARVERRTHFDRHGYDAFYQRLGAIAAARRDLEQARDQLDADEQALDACQAELDALDAAIADLADKIAACEAAVATSEADIESLITGLEECEQELRALEDAQTSLRRDLRKARQALERARRELERQRQSAAGARSDVDRRAGHSDDLDADREAVDDELDELDRLEEELDEIEQQINDAEAANEGGDPASGGAKLEEATDDLEEAASGVTTTAEGIARKAARIRSRVLRNCDDGDERFGPWLRRKVAVRVLDVAVAPAGAEPEEWASRVERGRGVIGAILDVFAIKGKIMDPVGAIKDWLWGEATDAAKEALSDEDYPLGYDIGFIAHEIFDTWIRIFEGTTLIYIHVRLEGYEEETRSHLICIDGLWEEQPVQRRIVNDPVQWTERINTPVHDFSAERRREMIAEVLERWLRQKGLARPPGE